MIQDSQPLALLAGFDSGSVEVCLRLLGPELHLLVDQHNLKERVVFTGMIEGNLRTGAYAEAQVYALPSYSENFGIAIIESLACGTPVVGTRSGGIG